MFVIFLNTADLFSGFLVLYVKKRTKSIKRKESGLLKSETNNSSDRLIYEETMINPKKILLIN